MSHKHFDNRSKEPSGLSCAARMPGEEACPRPAIDSGLCRMHLDGIEARILARLLPELCANETTSERSCPGDLSDLCETHREAVEGKVLQRAVGAQLAAAARPQRRSYDVSLPPGATPEQARARLQQILDRRRLVPSMDEAYTIPFEAIRFERRRAFGPSLVEGDEDVSFWFYEKTPEGGIVVSYGVKGTKAGKDMPLASRRLFLEMMELLRLMPGYREACEITGNPIRQPLATIAYKLLRGLITLDEIRFVRLSQAGHESLRTAESREQLPNPRKLIRLSPVEMARVLIEQGLPTSVVSTAVERLIIGSSIGDVERIVAAAISARDDDHSTTVPPHSRARIRSLTASPLFRYGHAVMRLRSNTAAAVSTSQAEKDEP